jgi:hypothetical protein
MFAPFHSDGRSGGKDKIKMSCPYIFLIKQTKIQGACMFGPFHSEGRSVLQRRLLKVFIGVGCVCVRS